MAQPSSHRFAAGRILASVILATTALLTHAQSPQTNSPAPPSFEVAAIRPSKPDPTSSGYDVSPAGKLTARALTLKELISTAYSVKYPQISGGPAWAGSTNFDIDAKIDDDLLASLNKLPPKERDAQVNLMLQSLLADRFKLQVRRDAKTVSAYALVVAKGRPKLTPSREDTGNPATPAPQEPTLSMSGGHWIARWMTMPVLANQLSAQSDIGRPVSNETGLKGKYDFDFTWAPSNDSPGSTLFTALEDQLGLKLEPRKSTVDTIVIEHAEPLTDN
jgi:uncharacterized protein (TIGR03435 family)